MGRGSVDLQKGIRKSDQIPDCTGPQKNMAGRFNLHVMGVFWKIL